MVRTLPAVIPKTARGHRTREALLRAAETVFGENGFHGASISAITLRAGVAMGTFYLYFQDKDDIFRALVDHMTGLLHAHLRKRTAPAATALEAERLALAAYLSFVSRHRHLHRIMLDAYSVDEAIYRRYLQALAELYAGRLAQGQRQGGLRPGDAEVRAWCLLGIGNLLGMRYARWKRPASMARVLDTACDLMAHGLAPR